ncbi:MAG: polyhydroxyalkanoic acid system family protein [Myxococcota bacterium]
MADILITMDHDKSAQEVKRLLKAAMKKEADKFGVETTWRGDICHFGGPVTGTLTVAEKDVEVELFLGLLTKPFKKEIARNIERALQVTLHGD